MEWSAAAEQAVARVPFFVRRRVRKRVEETARQSGATVVHPEHVKACRQQYFTDMEAEIRGYRVETCFGHEGCPSRAVADVRLREALEELLAAKDLLAFLRKRVSNGLKMHHEFTITVADCPNACSRPQIADIGLIGACLPRTGDEPCTRCGACVDACREEAVSLPEAAAGPLFDPGRCLACGQCIRACSAGALAAGRQGYRILIGGKLGRHPQLAEELPGIFNPEQALRVVGRCVEHHLEHNQRGERFGEVLKSTGCNAIREGLVDLSQ